MQQLQFPLQLIFKVSSLSNDFTAKDTLGNTVAYVKQKLFKLKEDVSIFSDETQTNVLYKIKADRWLDFNAAYSFTDAQASTLGKITRKGVASIFNASYQLFDKHDQMKYTITEKNAWVKVADGLLGEIPILGFFTGYLFNPTYYILDVNNEIVVEIKKEASFWGRKFTMEKRTERINEDQLIVLLGSMMMILLERRRG